MTGNLLAATVIYAKEHTQKTKTKAVILFI